MFDYQTSKHAHFDAACRAFAIEHNLEDVAAIQLKNMRVTVSQQFQDKDQSGQTSATTKSEQGAKGKELRISGEIPFKSPEILKRIFELASATDAGGNRQKYRVAHEVARAVNFREATFSGMLDAPQTKTALHRTRLRFLDR